MPEPFPAESIERLQRWALKEGQTADPQRAAWLVDSAVRAVLRWATTNDVKRSLRGWEQTVRNAITDQWDGVSARAPKGNGPARDDGEAWRRERQKLREQIEREEPQRAARFRKRETIFPDALNDGPADTSGRREP